MDGFVLSYFLKKISVFLKKILNKQIEFTSQNEKKNILFKYKNLETNIRTKNKTKTTDFIKISIFLRKRFNQIHPIFHKPFSSISYTH